MPDPAPALRPDAPPRLTDRAQLCRARARADRAGREDWLHELVRDEIDFRLSEINKAFPDIAIVTGHPAFWRTAFPGARVVADDPVLDLPQASFDLVIHVLALHWADDPVGQMVQCARALRPDGLMLAVLPGGQTLAPLRAALAQAEIELKGGLSPRVAPFGEIRDLGALIGRAGLALPVADQLSQQVSYRGLSHLACDLRAMGEGNALALRQRRPAGRALFARADAILRQIAPDPQDADRIRVGVDLVFLTGWAPAPGQPQPLRPGSAQVSLADALTRTT